MYCEYFQLQFRFHQPRKCLLYSLTILLGSLNILYWTHNWKKQGIALCDADVFMALAQPAFQLILLVPVALLILSDNLQLLCSPTVLRTFSDRHKIGTTLFVSVLGFSLYTEVCMFAAALLARMLIFGVLPFNWQTVGSYYWFKTGHVFTGNYGLVGVGIFQLLASFITVITFSLGFCILSFLVRPNLISRVLAWGICLFVAWIGSSPVSPRLYPFRDAISFTADKLLPDQLCSYFFRGILIILLGYLLMNFLLSRRDFL